MRKTAFSAFLLLALAMATGLGAIPVNNIGLNIGVAMPGEKEIGSYYGVTINDSIYAYNVGLIYTFAPIEYFSIGAGCDYLYKSYEISMTTPLTYKDTTTFGAVEPYLQLRGYYPATPQIDIFAGGAAGYAILAGATYNSGILGKTFDLSGSGITYKFGGGVAYTQGMFTTSIEAGYKIASISPFTYKNGSLTGTAVNADLTNAAINLGGLYFNVNAGISFGSRAEARSDGDIKKQLDNDVKSLDTTSPASAAGTGNNTAPATAVSYAPAATPVEAKVAAAAATTAETPAATAGQAAAGSPAETTAVMPAETTAATVLSAAAPAPAETKTPQKAAGAAEIAEDQGNEEGIIILMPGESEPSQLEKYVARKSSQFKPVEGGGEGEEGGGENAGEEQQAAGGETTFQYEPDTSGIVLLENESRGKLEKAGYVLVERGGFISDNFTEDGFIYSLDDHKEILSTPDFAYIRLTVGKGAPAGKEFTIYDDSEDVFDKIAGEQMGKLISFKGVAKVVSHIEDNIYKVQISKSYAPIQNNFKIKARQDLKKYHKEINMKVRKKNLSVEAFIVKVQGDAETMSIKDLVYIDAGLGKGLLPGERMGIFRPTSTPDSTKEDNYHRVGTLIILNSVQNSSVGLITSQDALIKIGDIVKTIAK
jgi:hypothetical protein